MEQPQKGRITTKLEYAKMTFAIIYAFEKISRHLKHAKKDKRKREQMRARIAIKHIKEWLIEGKKVYEYANKIKF